MPFPSYSPSKEGISSRKKTGDLTEPDKFAKKVSIWIKSLQLLRKNFSNSRCVSNFICLFTKVLSNFGDFLTETWKLEHFSAKCENLDCENRKFDRNIII